VLTQQPAREPWQPVTPYDFESRKAIEGKHPELIKEVFQPRHVLDYGCGPEACLLRLLREIGVDAAGWDVPEHLRKLERHERARLDRQYDLVICREVMEHCTVLQIRRIVSDLCRLSSRYVYFTTRLHPNPQSLLDVATHDGLDPTHISICSKDFLSMLFILEGFRRRQDLADKMDWRGYGRTFVFERTF
jgi:hypothetical protein